MVSKKKKTEHTWHPSSWDLKGPYTVPSYRLVKFLTLIKKDGEALGVRSSNESMFMHFPQGK